MIVPMAALPIVWPFYFAVKNKFGHAFPQEYPYRIQNILECEFYLLEMMASPESYTFLYPYYHIYCVIMYSKVEHYGNMKNIFVIEAGFLLLCFQVTLGIKCLIRLAIYVKMFHVLLHVWIGNCRTALWILYAQPYNMKMLYVLFHVCVNNCRTAVWYCTMPIALW
jgi:hypothetical protein